MRLDENSDKKIISCQNEKFIAEKFTLIVYNEERFSQQINLTFTSFLYASKWGITNIKFMEGCSQFTIFDLDTKKCEICDKGFYPIFVNKIMS